MRLLEFLILIETVSPRQIFGRHKGKINRPESKFSGSRQLSLGTNSFTGFKRPDSLGQTTKAPVTVKPQGLSLSSRNRNLPGLKPLEIDSAIKPSSGNRFSLSGGARKMTSFSQISQVASIGIEKSKFVNGGERNPEVKVEGNLSKGPGFAFLPGLTGGGGGGGKQIQTKKFTPSSGSSSGFNKLDTTAPKRYGAYDSAASAASAYRPPADNTTPSRGPGGFGASFSSGFDEPAPAQSQQHQAPMSAPSPYQPSYETQPFTPSHTASSPSSASAVQTFGGVPNFQQAPSFDARTGQSAYASAPAQTPLSSSGFDRFGSFQQAIPQLAAPLATQAPSKQNLPVWNGGGGFSLPPPPLVSDNWQSVNQPEGTLSWDTHQTAIQQSLQAPVQSNTNSLAGLANSRPASNTISSSISAAINSMSHNSSMSPIERLRAAKARLQAEQQAHSNQRMAEASDSRSFVDKYASGPQMSAGFGGMDQMGTRNTLGAVNSYRQDDIRHVNQQQQQQGVTDHYKPPEKRTTGNPFNAEVQDQWDGETSGAQFHAMDEMDRQEYKNKNPDQWGDLDGDGVLEFDPDMPPYPSYKFFTETKWESETSGGYIGIIYVPVTRTVDGWSLTLKFSMPISMIENWEYQPLKQSPVDGVTAVLNSEHWNGVREEGTQMRIRMMVEFPRTEGMPPGLIPQPAVAILGTIWYPDGSHANYDEGNTSQAVSYSEGFAGLPKPEGASNTKSYVNHGAKSNEPEPVSFNSANMFTSNQQVRASISFQDPLRPLAQTTQATTTRKYSSNILHGINSGPTQAPLSGNLAALNQVYQQNDSQKQAYDALQQRISELTRMVQGNVIHNAFGQVKTTMETTTTQATTRRALSACEKRKIAEEHKCKEASCFRHRCLADGHFSPSQCWPKVKLCWCVTIKGMKLNTTLRPMTKFNPAKCNLTYDPTGIKASLTAQSATIISGSATISAKSGSVPEKPTVPPTTIATTTTTVRAIKFMEYARHDWVKVINLSTKFYAAQESGKLEREDYPVRWRQSAHVKDGRQCGLDLEGGYYDAADYMKYTFPLAWTMTMLSWSAIEHRSTLEELGLWDKYVHVIEHGAKWLMKANPEQRTLVAVVGDPDIDHQSWGRPQDQIGPRPCMKVSRYAPGTDVAAEAAAALAAASQVMSDERQAEMAWIKAKQLYDFADKHRGLYSKVVKEVKGYYEGDSYTDELAWGALWLYRGSKLESDKIKYMNRAKSAYKQFQLNKRVKSFNWDQKHAGVQLLMAELTYDKTYRAHVIAFCDHNMPHGGAKYTPGGLLFIEKWGVLRHALNIAFICLRTSLLPGMDAIRTANYRNFAISQLDYILGAHGRSFLVGYGKNYPDRPHHRAASCSLIGECGWDAYKNDVPNPQALLGALVGGPDEFDEFVNNRTDYVRNEVALDYNAAITSISALMLDLERGNVG